MNERPSSQDDVINALSILKPGKLPLDIFNQVARLTVTPVVELVPFCRKPDGSLQIFLLQRSPDDPLWANMYHVPGAIVSAMDQPGSFSDTLRRISTSKLADYEPCEPTFIDVQLCKVTRGMEAAIVYATELKIAPSDSALFDPLNLPSNMIEGQTDFIKAVLQRIARS